MVCQNRTEQRNSTIDVLKGICIIFVVITHYKWTDTERLCLLFPFWVGMAVPVFMIISGYVFTKSFERHSIDSFGKAYEKKFVISRVIRFTIPFFIAYTIEEIANLLIYRNCNPIKSVYRFLVGGIGPGAYYYPIMIQFIFYFPMIFFIIKKYKQNGFICCIIINFVYELLQRAYGMNEECYRMLVFRYTLTIAFGCYMAISKMNINIKLLVAFEVVGLIYIVLFKYVKLTPPITIYFTGTSYLASMFIMPIVFIIMKKTHFSFKPLVLIGHASFDVFLVQMVYYSFGVGIIYKISNNVLALILLNLIICCFVGIVFFYIESKLTRTVTRIVINRIK